MTGILAVVVAVVGAVARAQTLTEVDSKALANALHKYDVVTSSPIPPGYPLVVAAAHLLTWLGQPVGAYVALAIICSAASVVVTYVLGRDMFGPWRGLVAAAIVAACPLMLYYAAIVSVYPTELLWTPLIALMSYRTATRSSQWAPYLLFPALAVGAGFRPTLLALMLPVCVVAVVRGRPQLKAIVISVASGAGIVAAWGIPMIVKSQGWAAYEQATGHLWRSWASKTSLLYGAPITAAAHNAFTAMAATCSALLLAILLLAVFPLRITLRPLGSVAGVVLVAWIVPYLALYVFVLFGKPGYVLAYLPALALVAAALLPPTRQSALLASGGAAVAAVAFLALPMLSLPWRLDAFIPTAGNIKVQDAESHTLAALAPSCPPATCEIVSLPSTNRLWENSAESLSWANASNDRVIFLAQMTPTTNPSDQISVLWIGSDIPAAVREMAHLQDHVGTWWIYRSNPAVTQWIAVALHS